jgi:NAD(P)H-hydrate epimerase
MNIVHLTRSQVRQVDKRAFDQYHIPGIVLMENAARAVAVCAWELLARRPGNVLILCGGGNNGGDGLAVARHLHNRGAIVHIGLTVDPKTYQGDALLNWNIISAMNIPAKPFETSMLNDWPGLIVDAIFGTGLSQPVRDPYPAIFAAINSSGIPVLAVDLPSGLDCDTGKPLGACIKATATLTLVAPKVGFSQPDAKQFLGDVVVGDIGCPRELVVAAAHDFA